MPALILQKRHAERRGDRVPSPERGHGALLGGAVGRQDERERRREGREKLAEMYLITHEFNKHGNEGGNRTLAFICMIFCIVKCLFSGL